MLSSGPDRDLFTLNMTTSSEGKKQLPPTLTHIHVHTHKDTHTHTHTHTHRTERDTHTDTHTHTRSCPEGGTLPISLPLLPPVERANVWVRFLPAHTYTHTHTHNL